MTTHTPPEIASLSSSAFPRIRVDEVKVRPEARAFIDRYIDIRDTILLSRGMATSLVEIQLKWLPYGKWSPRLDGISCIGWDGVVNLFSRVSSDDETVPDR